MTTPWQSRSLRRRRRHRSGCRGGRGWWQGWDEARVKASANRLGKGVDTGAMSVTTTWWLRYRDRGIVTVFVVLRHVWNPANAGGRWARTGGGAVERTQR